MPVRWAVSTQIRCFRIKIKNPHKKSVEQMAVCAVFPGVNPHQNCVSKTFVVGKRKKVCTQRHISNHTQ